MTMPASATIATLTGQASYLVMLAAVSARPAACGHRGASRSTHSATVITATIVVANSSGSVIGVLCRYRRFGLATNNAAAVRPPAAEPVVRRMSRATAHAAMDMLATEIAIANAPVL